MKNNPKISVIVPVYNVERFLPKCIESILNQTFTDFEVLLIDDGSTDKSGKICDSYADKDIRVRVFHKKNGGVSSARQLGKEEAKGDYAIHVDSDDWIDSEMLACLYEEACRSKSDLIICDYFEEKDGQCTVIGQQPDKLEPESVLDGLLDGRLHGSCCNKLISREKYKPVTFPQSLSITEDQIYIFNVLSLKPKISYVDRPLYHYVIQTDITSLSKTYTPSRFFEIMDALNKAVIIFDNKAIREKIKKNYIRYLVYVGLKSKNLSGMDFRRILRPYCFTYLTTKDPLRYKFSFILSFIGLKKLMLQISKVIKG